MGSEMCIRDRSKGDVRNPSGYSSSQNAQFDPRISAQDNRGAFIKNSEVNFHPIENTQQRDPHYATYQQHYQQNPVNDHEYRSATGELRRSHQQVSPSPQQKHQPTNNNSYNRNDFINSGNGGPLLKESTKVRDPYKQSGNQLEGSKRDRGNVSPRLPGQHTAGILTISFNRKIL